MSITLIVETGLKPANANSYVSLAEADAYHTTYAHEDWTGNTDDELRKQSIVLATQSVDLLYGAKYMSAIYPSTVQALLFPRMWFTDANGRIVTENTIPAALKNAVCEIALMYLNGGDIFPQQSTSSQVKNKESKVGDLLSKIEYFKPVESETFSGFRKVDILLRPILKTQSASWSLRA